MRFLVMAIVPPDFEQAPPPPPEAYVAMQQYNEQAVKDGVLLAAEGLTPTSKGARVVFDGEERLIMDGPFAETKELVAGFMIIKADSLAEAIEWVKQAPNCSPGGKGLVEIRKLMDIEDFPEDFVPNEEIKKVKFS